MMQIHNNVKFPARRPSSIVRAVMTLSGVGSMMFNDRRKNGGRSIKVWGWRREHYELAVDIMRRHGFDATIVEGYWNCYGRWHLYTRIHTTPTIRVTRGGPPEFR